MNTFEEAKVMFEDVFLADLLGQEGVSMEERMISIGLFDVDSETGCTIKSFFAPAVPDIGDSFWIDDKSDMLNPSLIEYKVVKKSWVLMLLPAEGG